MGFSCESQIITNLLDEQQVFKGDGQKKSAPEFKGADLSKFVK